MDKHADQNSGEPAVAIDSSNLTYVLGFASCFRKGRMSSMEEREELLDGGAKRGLTEVIKRNIKLQNSLSKP